MASGYIRELLAREAGLEESSTESLTNTLKELFSIFFQGKEFLGPQPTPDGGILFNVRTTSGSLHDINELSSGEKELLFGYLRLRNSAPKNCVLLIDEPELHLNPRLIEGLPEFYHRNLGKSLNNQLWLVTHSDSILRQAVGNDSFSVYHMQTPLVLEAGTNQVHEVKASEETERAIIDLVGDLAAYRPGAKAVVLEGGGDTEFDIRMVSDLFPDFQARVNLLSGGNKKRVKDLNEILDEARRKGAIPVQIYSITDRDFDSEDTSGPGTVLHWDRFHIENYLLETGPILQVLRDLNVPGGNTLNESNIESQLKECAELTLPSLVRHVLEEYANRHLIGCINTRTDPNNPVVADLLRVVIEASSSRVESVLTDALKIDKLREMEREETARLRLDLESGEWRKTFRGRDILKRFVNEQLKGLISYQVFRDLILSRMRDANFKPPGMKSVLDSILVEAKNKGSLFG